jgi:hypothetical protein
MVQGIIPNPIKNSELLSFSSKGGGKKPEQPKSSAEIIQAASPDGLLMKQLAALIQKNALKLLQIGETVFALRPMPDGSVEAHIITQENPKQIANRVKVLPKSLKQMGFKKVTSYATEPGMARVLQSTGLPIRMTKTSQMIGGTQQPIVKFELDL